MTRSLNYLVALTVSLMVVGAAHTVHAELVADFENLSLPKAYSGPGGGTYWNGDDSSGSFATGGATFSNSYNTTFKSWSGWASSSTIDTITAGLTNQYSAYTLKGAHGQKNFGKNYGVGYLGGSSATIDLPSAPVGAHFTNTTYAALSMLNGDSFAKKFGGAGGSDADWFKLTILGKDAGGSGTGEVEFYLANYESSDNADDYLIHDWTWVDLTGLGAATRKLEFALSSSDVGTWGMNTPAYFAMDNLTTVPEPGTATLFGIALLVGIGGYSRRRSGRGTRRAGNH